MNVFNEDSVRSFFEMISKHLHNKSTGPIEAVFPSSSFLHTFSGNKNGEIFFNVMLLMTTNKDLLMQIENVIREFMHNNRDKFNMLT